MGELSGNDLSGGKKGSFRGGKEHAGPDLSSKYRTGGGERLILDG